MAEHDMDTAQREGAPRELEAVARPDEHEEELERLAREVEDPALQDRIIDRYLAHGRELFADAQPQSLDPRMIAELEPLLGDVSGVRVHTSRVAQEAARAMDARAFAIGDDVFFGEGEFDLASDTSRALIAHEVAHTRDAATGFAMSSRETGTERSQREAFAHDVQERYAAKQSEARDADAPAPSQPAEPKVDKRVLAEMIVQVLERQAKRSGERHGK